MTNVLDASAVLAWLNGEPGAEVVRPLFGEGLISAVNWSEVLQKARDDGRDPIEAAALLEARGLSVTAATRGDAILAAKYWERGLPLSLADRFCLALAFRFDVPAVTTDRAWSNLDLGCDVVVIR